MKHLPLALFIVVMSPVVLAGFIFMLCEASFLVGKEAGIKFMRGIA